MTADLIARAQKIKLVLFDVDGVMTDGTLFLADDGQEYKGFHSLDGHGLKMLKGTGVELGIITGRSSRVVEHRARSLGIEILHQGAHDKLAVYESLCRDLNIACDTTAYMGDDVLDLPVLRRVGFAACPSDAHEAVRERVHYVCDRPGGRGAVREFVDLWLELHGKREAVAERFWNGPGIAGSEVAGGEE